ncbi:hypothetical protein VIBNIAM115_2050013 [Vibrio nigripulchritudo AM115]|nr:hypothetical protein VIBNIAM115_2050013 [Vibrio nigripulchritudo AM115]
MGEVYQSHKVTTIMRVTECDLLCSFWRLTNCHARITILSSNIF